MKTIYTSYFAKYKKIEEAYPDFSLISVANSVPKFLVSPMSCLKEFVPSWKIVNAYKNGTLDWEGYTISYKEQMRNLDLCEIYDNLPDKCVLLCWESPKNNCHRMLIAEYLEQCIEGLEVKELGI